VAAELLLCDRAEAVGVQPGVPPAPGSFGLSSSAEAPASVPSTEVGAVTDPLAARLTRRRRPWAAAAASQKSNLQRTHGFGLHSCWIQPRAAVRPGHATWPRQRQISDAHDSSRSCLCSSMGTIGARAVRPQPVVPFRGRVARQLVGLLIRPWRDWTYTDAASGWPGASTVGYGSARGAKAAHRRSDR
jgi:hypothetical protein